tara:strand:+ start:1646 stop:1909 length:264 start_codon:yes stop_codon:yes gene_type:complete
MDIAGTVTISLSDYTKLKEEYPKASIIRNNLHAASKEIEVFLSFVCSREDILPLVHEYNRQAKHSQIKIIDDKAKIEFNEEINNTSK